MTSLPMLNIRSQREIFTRGPHSGNHRFDTEYQRSRRRVWGSYRVSVDAIKKQISYDLLSSVPESVQWIIEAESDQNNP